MNTRDYDKPFMQAQDRPNPNMEREMKTKSLHYKELLELISAQRGESALFNNGQVNYDLVEDRTSKNT